MSTFHLFRLSICLFILSPLIFLFLLMGTQLSEAVEPIAQHDHRSENESEVIESFFDRMRNSKRRQISPHSILEQNSGNKDNRTSGGVLHIKKINFQSVDTKLLDEKDLLDGEVLDEVKSPKDVVIKYDNGMFGLTDTDPVLHVWRAPFPTIGEIWPHPWSVDITKDVFTLCSKSGRLYFKLTGVDNYIIQDAITRYKIIICDKMVSFYPPNWRQQEHLLDRVSEGNRIFSEPLDKRELSVDIVYSMAAIYKGELKYVNIFIETSGHQWPSLYMNESYRVSVNNKGIFIFAKETWGALRALESVSQLAWRTRSGRVFINASKIVDQPRFKHRGMMLDTARHFVPKEVILKNIDAMEMNKLNVFHWHLTDDQSFPLVMDNHPEFAKHGSYDPETKVYRPADVREIVEYARLRGIRVIPEIDSPSHSLSWRNSHPELLTRCIDLHGKWSGHYGPVNMASASTYRLLKSMFTDVVHLFQDQWIHIGSDEVPNSCLLSNPAIQKWMQSHGMYSVDMLIDFYTRKLQNVITEIGQSDIKLQRGFIVWQEAYERNTELKKGTIVQLWKSQSTSEAAVLARQKIFVIYSACWYLDRLEYGAQWTAHYNCDPSEDFGSMAVMNERNQQQQDRSQWLEYILGGEAAMWMEFFEAGNVLQRIW